MPVIFTGPARKSLLTGASLLLLGRLCCAQDAPAILVVSQPGKGTEARAFVDLAPWISSQLQETGTYRPLVYRSSLPAVKSALGSHAVAASDLVEPLGKDAARKIARVLGASYVMRASGRDTKEGIAADVEVEMLTGQQAWSVVLSQHFDPYRPKDPKSKKPSTLEGIHAQAASIVQQLTSMPVRIPVSAPVDVRTGKVIPNPGKTGPTSPPGSSPERPTAPSQTAQPAVSKLQPSGPSTNEILVDRFRKQGDLPNMIEALRKAVNDKPRDAKLRELLVQAYVERGWDGAAADEANRAISVVPQSAPLHRLLGDCCKALGQADQAVAEYEMAAKLNGKDPANHIALGDGYWNAAKPDAALRAYTAAVQADPKSPLGHRRLARIYAETARFSDAAAEMNAARALTPPDDSAGYADDFAAVLGIVEADLSQILAKLQAGRQDLISGRRTREQVFGEEGDQKKRSDDLAVFMDALQPPAAYTRVHSLYVQAAGLVAQAAELSLRSIESQDTSREESAALLRVEAGKQIADASSRLKALRAPAPPAH